MRTIAVSATLPNITDVAEFLGGNEAYTFDGSFRPVPLTKHVTGCGYLNSKNEFKFWDSLDDQVVQMINRFSAGKQTIVFCHTKRDTERLCATLIKQRLGKRNAPATTAPAGTVEHCLVNGVAYHHAGMPQDSKNRVEQAFTAGEIRCLCATSTLAVGVNLPAHLVIVKGTRAWRGGSSGYQDIDKSSLLQMIGRAGRPGLDTSGVAVIMTDNKSKSLVEVQIQGLGPAESRLLGNLVDVLNTEISQRVVTDVAGAIKWLKTTYLFGRLRQEPAKYAMDKSFDCIDTYMNHFLERAIGDLVDADLVRLDTTGAIYPLPACHIMSQGMVPYESMKAIASLPHDSTQCQVLKSVSKMEILNMHVRRNEKKFLNECHKIEEIIFKLDGPPSKVRIQEPWQKAFVLLQAYIGRHTFTDFTLGQQMTSAANNAQRMLMAAQEYSVEGSRNGYVALQCLKLRRSFHFSCWGKNDGILNQIEGVGPKATAKLKLASISSFQHVVNATEEQLESGSGKSKPFGKQIKTIVSKLLQLQLKLSADITFTRGSNIAADVTCDVRFSDPTAAAMSGTKKGDASYALVSDMHLAGKSNDCGALLPTSAARLYRSTWDLPPLP
jgi:ATP-dependent DNA helicase HFM1/MER3